MSQSYSKESTQTSQSVRGITHPFRGNHRCPVCGGAEDDPRGQDLRCFGFSTDNGTCFCTRSEYAGSAKFSRGANGYRHRIEGPCPCGVRHKEPVLSVVAAPPKKKKPGKFECAYDYHRDGASGMTYQVVRTRDEDGKKGFYQRQPDGHGGWVNSLKGITTFLYRRPELFAADPAEVVLITEGEKDVERLRSLGFVATCNAMGAGKWQKRYADDLRGRRVAIIPDCDLVGADHAKDVARSLVGVAAEIKVIELPNPAERKGFDVSDWLDDGATADDLRELIEGSPVWDAGRQARSLERPMIEITTEAHEVVDQAVAALAADPDLYQRARKLVRVARDPSQDRKFRRAVNSPSIVEVENPTLLEKLTRYAAFVRPVQDRNGNIILAKKIPPDWAVAAVAARMDWPQIRSLEAVIEAPTLRPDGSILDQPGYDESTGLLYVPNAAFPPIPERPTREDAIAAAKKLLFLVTDFPFAVMFDRDGNGDGGAAHRAAWLAALLTVLAKFTFNDASPIFVFDAPTPAAGKTLLVDIVSIIASGRVAARTTFPESDDEMRKRITAIALAGDLLVLLDNIAHAFGGQALDSALTGVTWKDRVLCTQRMTPEIPLHTTWFGTGNNIQFKGDLVRRVCCCRLQPDCERPEERDPDSYAIKEDLKKYVARHRAELLVAGLTILRAYEVAGRPPQKLKSVDYRNWSDLVRSAVHWTIGSDPCATREEVRATDSESTDRVAMVNGFAELPGSESGLTASEVIKLLEGEPGNYEIFRTAIMTRKGELPSAKSLGKILGKVRGRVVGDNPGLAIQSVPAGKNTLAWKVVRTASKTPPGGFSGNSGFANHPTRENCADNCSTKKGDKGCLETHQSHQTHSEAPGRERFTL